MFWNFCGINHGGTQGVLVFGGENACLIHATRQFRACLTIDFETPAKHCIIRLYHTQYKNTKNSPNRKAYIFIRDNFTCP